MYGLFEVFLTACTLFACFGFVILAKAVYRSGVRNEGGR